MMYGRTSSEIVLKIDGGVQFFRLVIFGPFGLDRIRIVVVYSNLVHTTIVHFIFFIIAIIAQQVILPC